MTSGALQEGRVQTGQEGSRNGLSRGVKAGPPRARPRTLGTWAVWQGQLEGRGSQRPHVGATGAGGLYEHTGQGETCAATAVREARVSPGATAHYREEGSSLSCTLGVPGFALPSPEGLPAM